jgi:excisionase family DNA binding protein
MPDLLTWISTTEAAKALGVSKARVLQLLYAGKLTGVKMHSQLWLIDPVSISRRLENRRT